MAETQTIRFRIGQPIWVGLLSFGTLASGGALSYTAGVATYLANPEPAACNGTCAPKLGAPTGKQNTEVPRRCLPKRGNDLFLVRVY